MGQGTVVIIGGGAAGLSAAWTLKKRGFKTILLEASHRVGGRLGTDRIDGFTLDYGADFFCNSYDVTFRICEELGLSLIRSEMNLGWYRNGSWARTFPLRSFNDAFRNIRDFGNWDWCRPGSSSWLGKSRNKQSSLIFPAIADWQKSTEMKILETIWQELVYPKTLNLPYADSLR